MDNLLPKHIADLTAYSSAKSEKIEGSTWLNANESPYSKTLNLTIADLNRYPDPQPQNVIDNYANYANLSNEQVLMTRGADEGIELLIRTFCESAKDSIALFLPTYGMYKVSAQSHNVALNELSQTELFNDDATTLVAKVADAKIVFICNPNNPTGSLYSVDKIRDLAALLPKSCLLVVDEAYIDFCYDQSSVSLLEDFDNVVVLRTLSKAFALAGLRCGFVLANPPILAAMKKVIAPYPVSSVVAAIAGQALSSDGISIMKRQVKILNELKSKLQQTLTQSDAVIEILEGQGKDRKSVV